MNEVTLVRLVAESIDEWGRTTLPRLIRQAIDERLADAVQLALRRMDYEQAQTMVHQIVREEVQRVVKEKVRVMVEVIS